MKVLLLELIGDVKIRTLFNQMLVPTMIFLSLRFAYKIKLEY
jgi:hypothetical protein